MSEKTDQKAIYEIRVEGSLGEMWRTLFEGMTIRQTSPAGSGQCITILTGPVEDQPALHGLLTRVRDLNLILVSVQRIEK